MVNNSSPLNSSKTTLEKLKYDSIVRLNYTTQAFYTQLYEEMMVCQPGHSHQLLEALIEEKSVVRHYTMNIDGLSNKNTIPIHGNIKFFYF